MRSGTTLLELTVVLGLIALAGTVFLPAARRQADRAALVGAREAVAALVAKTRTEAILAGAASLRVRADDGEVAVLTADSLIVGQNLGSQYGVTIELGRRAKVAELHFDGLGLGRVASRTITLRRGQEEVQLVVSAYGRAVRR